MTYLLEKVILDFVSLQDFYDVRGYVICCQNLLGVFPLGGTLLSSTSETYDSGVDNDLETLFFHPSSGDGENEQ